MWIYCTICYIPHYNTADRADTFTYTHFVLMLISGKNTITLRGSSLISFSLEGGHN